MVHALASSAHPIPTLEPQPPTTTPVTSQLSMVTLLFKRHVQTSKGWLNKLSQINKPPPSKNHIFVFMAETQMEEDLLYQFRNWTTQEEECKEYQNQFLNNYWPHLPRDVTHRIRVMFFKAMY